MNNKRESNSIREKLKQQIESDCGWYFIALLRDLPPNRLYGFTLFDEPFVLFRNKNDNLVCCLLPCNYDANQDIFIEIRGLEVIEKQGEIWFYRGNIQF